MCVFSGVLVKDKSNENSRTLLMTNIWRNELHIYVCERLGVWNRKEKIVIQHTICTVDAQKQRKAAKKMEKMSK